MRGCLLVPLLLLSCSSPPEVPGGGEHNWNPASRPVDLLLSEDMSVECASAVGQAVQFWRGHGVDYLIPREVPATHPAVNGLPRYREIGVSEGALSDNVAGMTFRAYNAAGLVFADITLADCAPQTAAHEIGHALGLEDIYDLQQIDRLMYGARVAGHEGWALSATEQEFVK